MGRTFILLQIVHQATTPVFLPLPYLPIFPKRPGSLTQLLLRYLYNLREDAGATTRSGTHKVIDPEIRTMSVAGALRTGAMAPTSPHPPRGSGHFNSVATKAVSQQMTSDSDPVNLRALQSANPNERTGDTGDRVNVIALTLAVIGSITLLAITIGSMWK